jgi:type VI secretion system secreted protein VgrG
MLLTSPAGIAFSTQQSAQISADQQLNVVSAQSTQIAAGKSLMASVAQSLSLFGQNAGMKLFAANGKVELRAHSDTIEATAQKSLKLLSVTQTVEAAAKREVLLTSGGAYLRIAGGNIEIHAPGKIDFKGAQHAFGGPTRQPYDLPALPTGNPHNTLELNLTDDALKPVPNAPYKVRFDNGTTMSGTLDANGHAVLHDVPSGSANAFFGEDPRPFVPQPLPAARALAPDDVLQELQKGGANGIDGDNLASLFNRFAGHPDIDG